MAHGWMIELFEWIGMPVLWKGDSMDVASLVDKCETNTERITILVEEATAN